MNINDINASLGNENNTINANLPNINYIPGYKEAEEQRRNNELVRISNENNREIFFNNMKSEYESGSLNGATFLPSVSEEGNISWTNDKGLENPTTRNIKGPKGDTGDKGDKGDKGDAGSVNIIDENINIWDYENGYYFIMPEVVVNYGTNKSISSESGFLMYISPKYNDVVEFIINFNYDLTVDSITYNDGGISVGCCDVNDHSYYEINTITYSMITTAESRISNLFSMIGTLGRLTTDAKNNLVAAINEVNGKIGIISTTLDTIQGEVI